MANIQINQLAESISSTMEKWSTEVEEQIKNAVNDCMKDLVESTKRDAPVLTGSYKRNISSKVTLSKNHEYQQTWYVKAPDYRLTHILEKGYQKKNGGRVQPREHIGKNAERVKQQFEQKVKEAIENG